MRTDVRSKMAFSTRMRVVKVDFGRVDWRPDEGWEGRVGYFRPEFMVVLFVSGTFLRVKEGDGGLPRGRTGGVTTLRLSPSQGEVQIPVREGYVGVRVEREQEFRYRSKPQGRPWNVPPIRWGNLVRVDGCLWK